MKLLLTILTVLSSFLANLEEKTLQSAFTVTVAEEVNAPMNFPGEIIMHGRNFRLEMMDIEAAYDGKTMYMYSGETDELTLSNPTDQELLVCGWKRDDRHPDAQGSVHRHQPLHPPRAKQRPDATVGGDQRGKEDFNPEDERAEVCRSNTRGDLCIETKQKYVCERYALLNEKIRK